MDFSHLADTKFPNIETASPYALKNTFDYTRWVPDTKIHLVNVLWNNDYTFRSQRQRKRSYRTRLIVAFAVGTSLPAMCLILLLILRLFICNLTYGLILLIALVSLT